MLEALVASSSIAVATAATEEPTAPPAAPAAAGRQERGAPVLRAQIIRPVLALLEVPEGLLVLRVPPRVGLAVKAAQSLLALVLLDRCRAVAVVAARMI